MAATTCLAGADQEPKRSANAASLSAGQRQDMALKAIIRDQPLSRLAAAHGVSRKFVYAQAARASEALHDAFTPTPQRQDVLFYLPVTVSWIEQFIVAQTLLGHTSFRGVIELAECLLDYPLSLGNVCNVVQNAVGKAALINNQEVLTFVRVGAHDEIYQAHSPVLVGVDVSSTYCYLLAAEDHCDETSWGVHLLELGERGLAPVHTIGDGGRGLRAGQKAAWPETPCHGDVFHAELDLGRLAFYLENRAFGCVAARQKLEATMQRAKNRSKGQSFSRKLANARTEEARAVALAQDVRILSDWMQNDILSLAGPSTQARCQLFDFVVAQLKARESLCPHRIAPLRRKLENQRDDLLAFAMVLDGKLARIAAHFSVSPSVVHAVCELQNLDQGQCFYWQRQTELRSKLHSQNYQQIETAVIEAMLDTPRTSSIVENINSRLRNYFFLRRHIGNDYLTLLRFFLNHHRFLRSDRAERVGKSPAELLTGKPHAHWLELLGYQCFQRN